MRFLRFRSGIRTCRCPQHTRSRVALLDGDAALIGPDLRRELEDTLSRNEQAVLFINRRGSARMAVCIDCGYVPECQNCSVALTYHSRNGRLMCHHCGFSIPLEHTCPVCGSEHIRLIGAGTQKVEEELYALFSGCPGNPYGC